jgi:hypothetical protein
VASGRPIPRHRQPSTLAAHPASEACRAAVETGPATVTSRWEEPRRRGQGAIDRATGTEGERSGRHRRGWGVGSTTVECHASVGFQPATRKRSGSVRRRSSAAGAGPASVVVRRSEPKAGQRPSRVPPAQRQDRTIPAVAAREQRNQGAEGKDSVPVVARGSSQHRGAGHDRRSVAGRTRHRTRGPARAGGRGKAGCPAEAAGWPTTPTPAGRPPVVAERGARQVAVVGPLPSAAVLNRALLNRMLVNRALLNRTLVNRTMLRRLAPLWAPNRTTANRTMLRWMVLRWAPNRPLQEMTSRRSVAALRWPALGGRTERFVRHSRRPCPPGSVPSRGLPRRTRPSVPPGG